MFAEYGGTASTKAVSIGTKQRESTSPGMTGILTKAVTPLFMAGPSIERLTASLRAVEALTKMQTLSAWLSYSSPSAQQSVRNRTEPIGIVVEARGGRGIICTWSKVLHGCGVVLLISLEKCCAGKDWCTVPTASTLKRLYWCTVPTASTLKRLCYTSSQYSTV